MVLGPVAQQQLDRLTDTIRDSPEVSVHSPEAYPVAVQTFIDILRAGEEPDPDDVRDWALVHGWREDDAFALAEMAETVFLTLVRLGLVEPRRRLAGASP
jgi:hypothetical protein